MALSAFGLLALKLPKGSDIVTAACRGFLPLDGRMVEDKFTQVGHGVRSAPFSAWKEC